MAYKSDRVGVRQMLEELCRAERSPREAHLELATALENGAIPLKFDGQFVIEEITPIAKTLRAAAADPHHRPDGMLSARYIVILQAEDTADRRQFEKACQLEVFSQGRRLTAEEACKELIGRLKQGPRITRAATYAKAKADIPDLIDKEFDRAWEAVAPPDWKVGGRPKKRLH
jgi:hypothetical protein